TPRRTPGNATRTRPRTDGRYKKLIENLKAPAKKSLRAMGPCAPSVGFVSQGETLGLVVTAINIVFHRPACRILQNGEHPPLLRGGALPLRRPAPCTFPCRAGCGPLS